MTKDEATEILSKWKLIFAVVTGGIKMLSEVDKATGASDKIAKLFRHLWVSIMRLDGKKIAVIGATASGKNSLIARLRGDKVPTEHAQTRGSETVKSYNIKFSVPGQGTVEFKALKSSNVGGEEDERERYWADACRDADIVFYLVDVERIVSERTATIKRLKEDMNWIRIEGLRGKGGHGFKPGMKLALIANKIDSLSEVDDLDNEQTFLVVSKIKEDIEDIARGALGPDASGWLTGTYLLSTTDDRLFTLFFLTALMGVAESPDSSAKKGK